MLALRPSYAGSHLRLRPSYGAEVDAISVVTDIDLGNVHPAKVVIANGEGLTPLITVDVRDKTTQGQSTTIDTGWRTFYFAVENAEGRTPTFRIPRWRQQGNDPTTTCIPCYSTDPTDHASWVRASSRTLTGSYGTGYIQWTFDEPLPAGRVFISSHPTGGQEACVAFAAHMLANHSDVVSPTGSADANGVYSISPSEVDDLGREVGEHPMFALEWQWPDATTDGQPKRELLMTAQIHGAGEAFSWVVFRYFIDYVMFSSEPAAVALRKNWRMRLYFAVSPNAVYAGSRRSNLRDTTLDPNRNWNTNLVPEVVATRTAAIADEVTRLDALFTWHGLNDVGNSLFNIWTTPEAANAATRTPAMQSLLDEGTTIFGAAPHMVSAAAFNDVWWAQQRGAQVMTCCEICTQGTNSLEAYQFIGESWAKTLQAVDSQGLFVDPVTIEAHPGSAVAAGLKASIMTGQVIAAAAGAAIASGRTAQVSAEQGIQASTGAALAAGRRAQLSTSSDIAAGRGRATARALTARISAVDAIEAGVGSARARGRAAGVETGSAIPAGTAAARALGLTAAIHGTDHIRARTGAARANGLAGAVHSKIEVYQTRRTMTRPPGRTIQRAQ